MKDRMCLLSRKTPLLGVILAAAVLAFGPLAVPSPAEDGLGAAAATPTVQLSTQEPVAPLPHSPDWVYPVDGFAQGQDVWVAVPSVAHGRDLSGTKARVYIIPHRGPEGWADGARLLDISGGYEVISIHSGEAYDNYLMIWAGAQRTGTYDIVLDFKPAGIFHRETDLVDHGGKTGVPGFAVLGEDTVDYLMISPDAGFMGKVCTRIFGVGPYPGGLPEGVEFFVAYGWGNGDNGVPEDGGGDDVAFGPVSAEWSTTMAQDVARINELNGVYITGEHTGDGNVMATYPGATSDSVPINTTAPTWVRD